MLPLTGPQQHIQQTYQEMMQYLQDQPAHIMDLAPSHQWKIERQPDGQYSITIHSIGDVADFIQTLGNLTLGATPYSCWPGSPDLGVGISGSGSSGFAGEKPRRASVPLLPYIKYHSELYAKDLYKPTAEEWPRFFAVLPDLLDDCLHYMIECMNHYYPVRPKRLLMKWYMELEDPTQDPLALAIGAYWCRHVLIHHRPVALKSVQDERILDAVQTNLSSMARKALGECFDQPDVDHIYALCLCNMTNTLSLEQKAMYHTLAVRMAAALDIKPRHMDDQDESAELNNRLWWYLFQIDHFLHESGAISVSMLSPTSDNLEALRHLKRPTACSLDEPDELAGAAQWNNVLKLWLTRRELMQEIEETIDLGHSMEPLFDKVSRSIDSWAAELPEELKFHSTVTSPPNESCYALAMERCTNYGLLMHQIYHSLPHDSTKHAMTSLQRKAALAMVDSATEMIRIRRTMLSTTPCQTWPGDLKRKVEMLYSGLKSHDGIISSRSKLGLMHALRMLRSMAEIQWQDDICMNMAHEIEQTLSDAASVPNVNQESSPPASPSNQTAETPSTSSSPKARRSIRMADNMYAGMMMFDREMHPRAQYYKPARSSEALDGLTIIENMTYSS